MRHAVAGRKLGRDYDERRALLKSLVRELVSHGKITTTIAKAKAVQPFAEKLVTKAKVGSLANRRDLIAILPKENVSFFIESVASRFSNRNGGYTRIIKIGKRVGDNVPLAILEWVEQIGSVMPQKEKGKKEPKKTEAKEAAVEVKETKAKKTEKPKVKANPSSSKTTKGQGKKETK